MMRIAAIFLVLLLAGCARDVMNGYVGETLEAPMQDLGSPRGAYDADHGQRVFVGGSGVVQHKTALGPDRPTHHDWPIRFLRIRVGKIELFEQTRHLQIERAIDDYP